MPKGTKVDNMYEALKRRGISVESAVKIAQSKTGQALATGKPPKKSHAKNQTPPSKTQRS